MNGKSYSTQKESLDVVHVCYQKMKQETKVATKFTEILNCLLGLQKKRYIAEN